MIGVNRIAYAVFETRDLARKVEHYTEMLGLSLVSKDSSVCHLTCPLDDRSIILRTSSDNSCAELGFHVPAGTDLVDFEKQLSQHNIKSSRKTDPHPGVAELVSFSDPKGTLINVFQEPVHVIPSVRPSGVSSLKLGHVAFNVQDVAAVVAFYCEVLGFRFSDSIEDFFVWLRCSPEHHTVNFVRGARAKMHHIAFEVKDWPQLQVACDYLSKYGCPTIWGPGRHGCGHNLFAYHRDPDGQIIELFAELDTIREDLGYYEPRPWHRERPQRPKVWPADPAASNLWGPMPPSDFLD